MSRQADEAADPIGAVETGRRQGRAFAALGTGAVVGMLGGLIGLGGAEFRLPLLIGVFGFVALQAVILNKAISLTVVLTALPARFLGVPFSDVAPHWLIVVNLLIGSLLGAWLGATWATRMRSATHYRVLAWLLVLIAIVLVANHIGAVPTMDLPPVLLFIAGVAAGAAIGVVATLMGVAGGELLIPTIVLLYGIDARVAGSLSIAGSLPTMLVAFARYSQDSSFAVLGRNRSFVAFMAIGSVAGVIVGGLMLGRITETVIIPVLAALLLLSAWKVNQHSRE